MKILVNSVRSLKKSLIIEMYEKIIKGANESGDPRRIRAAKQVSESRARLIDFLSTSEKWKTKKGNYLVPSSDFHVVRAVSTFIKPQTILTKLIQYLGRNKSR